MMLSAAESHRAVVFILACACAGVNTPVKMGKRVRVLIAVRSFVIP